MKWIVVIAALLGLSSVVMGAASDHLLEGHLSAHAAGQIEVALRYHQLYSLVLLALGLHGLRSKASGMLKAACLTFVAGLVIFSGSLYLSVFLNLPVLTFGTPCGGLLLMLGWGLVAAFGLRDCHAADQ